MASSKRGPSAPKTIAVARRAEDPPVQPRASRAKSTSTVLANLSNLLDPARQAERDASQNAARAARSFESSQMFVQAQNVQDLTRRLDSAQNSLTEVRQRLYDEQRKSDGLQHRIEMMEMLHGQYKGPLRKQRYVF